jgi:hypothetical protein
VEERLSHGNISPRLLPDFNRLENREQDFLPARLIHLIADDAFNFLEYAEGKGHEGVNSGRYLAYHPGLNEETVAGRFSFRRRFP